MNRRVFLSRISSAIAAVTEFPLVSTLRPTPEDGPWDWGIPHDCWNLDVPYGSVARIAARYNPGPVWTIIPIAARNYQ